MDASYYCKSALLAQDVMKSWNRRKDVLQDCVTILEAFRKQDETTLYLENLEVCGESFKDCNEELRKVGICVEHESKHYKKGGILVYSLRLELIE